MSNYRNALKSYQKTHKERGQLESRRHIGFLEKKKDYKLRAAEHSKKEAIIKKLKRKAQDKNPDEFYFKMVKTKMENGVHQTEDKTPKYTDSQLKLMNTQDSNYVNYKRSSEQKKIDELKKNLHFIDIDKGNKHIIFVDTKQEEREFNPSQYFQTHPSLVNRSCNRPRLNDLKETIDIGNTKISKATELRRKSYSELANRLDRDRQLRIIQEKLNIKKQLISIKDKKRCKIRKETKDAPAVYKWQLKRKK